MTSNSSIVNVGTVGDDFIYVTGKIALGLAGNDAIAANDKGNLLAGGGGNDSLYGSTKTDLVLGGSGQDYIEGRGGNDFLFGGKGSDILWGNAGTDVLFGGKGNDFFAFRQGDTGLGKAADTILDFEKGVDKIFIANQGLTASDLHFTASGKNVIVGIDWNHDGKSDGEIVLFNYKIGDIGINDFVL